MDILAIADGYLAYEAERGIETKLPNFFNLHFNLHLLPSAAWLTWVGAIIFSSQILSYFPAIAHTPTYNQPIYGATVNTSGSCLNARQVPSMVGEIYTCVKKGETLKAIVKEENGWYQLTNGGWVAKQYVKLPPVKLSPAPTTSPPQAQTPRPNNLLQYNPNTPMQGEDIKTLQKHLNWYELLAHEVEVTGVFDLETKLAVEMFQKKRDLTIDGIVGPVTRAALGINS